MAVRSKMPCIGALYRRSCPGFYRVQVNITDRTFEERTLAVSEIEVPEADKFVREPQAPDIIDPGEETLTPVTQRTRIVRTNVFDMYGTQVGLLCKR